MAKFFIDRPIFAWVLSILLMLAGIVAIVRMPIAQFPEIAPPDIEITARYPGASAETISTTVTQVIEQRMTGLDNMLYMKAESDSSGQVQMSLTFLPGTNIDIAQVQVQNKLQAAMPTLPDMVRRLGVDVTKASNGFLMFVAFIDETGRLGSQDLADFIASNVRDPLSRLTGVGAVNLFGSQYAMRIWLDPAKLQSFNLMPTDVRNAIGQQNVQIAAGEMGAPPALEDQQLTAKVYQKTLLRTVDDFKRIFLKINHDGSRVILGDVARIELGAESYAVKTKFNGQPTIGMSVSLASGANALVTAQKIRSCLKELEKFFPEGVRVEYPYDSTPFIKLSISTVIKTLIEGVVLVFLVMLLFLQNFRATLITAITIPVVLLGTFATLNLFGCSINTLSMFAMVLAIGLLVDDAIVVVENVDRVMQNEFLLAREASIKAMKQVTRALIGITAVLSAVFIPMAFQSGSVGAIYRQFSLTIVITMVFSVFVALTLIPALCARILKPISRYAEVNEKKGFASWFNHLLDGITSWYIKIVKSVLNNSIRSLILYILVLVGAILIFFRLPNSFLPEEDQGVVFVQVVTPQGATQQRTQNVVDQLTKIISEKEKENVISVFSINGFSFGGTAQNTAMLFIKLSDWKDRIKASSHVREIIKRIFGYSSAFNDAFIFPFNLPSIPQMGRANGFTFRLKDQSNLGHDRLIAARNQILALASKSSILTGVRPNGLDASSVYQLEIDDLKAASLGLSLNDINQNLSIAWGPAYINQFLHQGRIKRVYLQGDASARMLPEDFSKWHIRNRNGEMVPFSAFSFGKWSKALPRLSRYNGVPSLEIQGSAAQGKSSGEAMREMERIFMQLPVGFGYEWTGISLQERLAGAQAPLLYALSILMVFLFLAVLYESWSIPFSVILVVPLGVIGALLSTYLRGLENNVYFHVGLLATIGLASKNAILIVEFAGELHKNGMHLLAAVIEACRLRLRPIVMTSMAFMFGVLPITMSNGAGAASQNAIGTTVMGGVFAATILAIFFVPLFYFLIISKFSSKKELISDSREQVDLISNISNEPDSESK